MLKQMHYRVAALAAALLLSFSGVGAQGADMGFGGNMKTPSYQEQIYPPWSHGKNNPAIDKGLEFTVPEVDNLPDFHGSINNPQFVIFAGGNYFFVMAPLVAAFEKEYPNLRGSIYYETLPPGILIKQMENGGTITVGNMTWTVHPDVYAADLETVDKLIHKGTLASPAVPYATNDLTIMIPKDNPAHITGLADLGKPGVRLAMPNPEFEGVARQIKVSLEKVGGKPLEQMVYDAKVKKGETILTQIHHRQTPLFLMQGRADAGVTWKSEAIFQEQAGHPIIHIPIPAKANTTAIYAAAMVKGAQHPQIARQWLDYLVSPQALKIFERYGFKPYSGAK